MARNTGDFDYQHFLAANPDIAGAPANWFPISDPNIGGAVKDHPEAAQIAYAVHQSEPLRPWRNAVTLPVAVSTPGPPVISIPPPASTTPPVFATPPTHPAATGGIMDMLTRPAIFGLPLWVLLGAGALFFLGDDK